jgi:hypothetical protein
VPQLETIDVELSEEQEHALADYVRMQLTAALEVHKKKEDKLARLARAYRARPEHEKKNFPWPNASNVVIPIVGITVDNIVARLMRSFMGMQNPVEAQIKEAAFEPLEKPFRDWAEMFVEKSGARDALRTCFHDMALDGTVYVKTTWEQKSRTVHSYASEGGGVSSTDVMDYEGPVWNVIPASDLVYPDGFDEWPRLPWIAHRLRFTWAELLAAKDSHGYIDVDEQLKSRRLTDDSPVRKARAVGAGRSENIEPGVDLYDFFELWGKFPIHPALEDGSIDPDNVEYQELILTFSMEDGRFHKKIHNPFFGRARHIVRIPFLHMPHEIEGLGAAEQVEQFQIEASTSHNQTIDSATAAIAGIVVKKSSVASEGGDQIYPGKVMIADDPKSDVAIFHLSMGNSNLPNVEQEAAFWAEKRSGVNAYSMGVESQIAGSRATATGTTALINEGNMRFWVSIDDMRAAIVDLFYLTLQLEQQLRPEGTPITPSKILQLPQGDLREIFGLRLQVSSEKVNRDIEIQNFQMLISILNEYYGRLMQAAAIIVNPAFPPPHKMIILAVMEASAKLTKKLVERFEIENIDEVVPGLMQAMQMLGGMVGGQNPMAPTAPGGPGPLPGQPPGGQGLPPGGGF